MRLHIYYRHTSVSRSSGKLRPPWFSHEFALLNLLATVEQHLVAGRVRLNVLFDGSEAEQQTDFAKDVIEQLTQRRAEAASSISVRRFIGGTQRKAWRACVLNVKADMQAGVSPQDIVYLLENDYLHLPGWVDEVLALAEQGVPWDYLTLYDHPDKYPNHCRHEDSRRYHSLSAQLYATSQRHWRTTPSTCATYMLTGETFVRDFSYLRLGLYDLRLFRLLRHFRRRRLLSPLPSLATHCMEGLLAPGVDWEDVAMATAKA